LVSKFKNTSSPKRNAKQQRKERERIDVYATIEEEIKLFRRYELDYYYY
jgi:hypothetical protein